MQSDRKPDPGPPNSVDPEDLMLTACLAASRKKKGIDTIDKAFLKSLKYYPRAKSVLSKYKVLQFHPFDPVSKKVVAVVTRLSSSPSSTTPAPSPFSPSTRFSSSTPSTPSPRRSSPSSSLPRVSASLASRVPLVLKTVEEDHPISEEVDQAYKNKVAEFATRGFRSLGVARKRGKISIKYSRMKITESVALEVDNHNFPTQTVIPAIIGWVVIGYMWFWYRSINIWVHWNGAIDTFTHYTENQQRTRIAAYCLIPLMFVGIWPLDLFGCIICYVSKAINNEQGLPRTLPIAETLNTTPTNPNVQHPDPPPPYNGVGAKCARP
ncbi:AR2 [Neurospora crassa OR74A]|uniref:AR2 n=1 Tax=Neurospora crassa (strain ATCC 24698 / 74-OR23-1A / CBS 708.71 / DSM 1257 / FGSC 987) TaxID=367110 RepID=Q7SDY0_NEUCR|nr:AR2 [Neurospora crassa OR74A]EAA35005.3 AR2 [Neurospora crassa OR74A]|eukprot:XP_964241.3 AR2 [Neurospora crassa OR74A]